RWCCAGWSRRIPSGHVSGASSTSRCSSGTGKVRKPMLLLEIAEFLAVLLLTWLGVDAAVQGALAKGDGLGAEIRTASEIHMAALKGFGMYAAGLFAL